jgi:hypothetical protein
MIRLTWRVIGEVAEREWTLDGFGILPSCGHDENKAS